MNGSQSPHLNLHLYINIHLYIYIYKLRSVQLDDTGRRRLVGCLRLQVICRKRATNYRALLRKMAYEDNCVNVCTSSEVCDSVIWGGYG